MTTNGILPFGAGGDPARIISQYRPDLSASMTQTPNSALDLLRRFEGFRSKPYWDVNAYRTGYGSDTITRQDGSIVPVQQGMTVTKEDAERDLQRRLSTEFIPRAQQAVGQQWGALPDNVKGALASVTYNYGSLPSVVAQAAQSGDAGQIAAAVRSLQGHNDGVNASRRNQEADFILNGSQASASPSPANLQPDMVTPALAGAMPEQAKTEDDSTARELEALKRQLASAQQTVAAQQPAVPLQPFKPRQAQFDLATFHNLLKRRG